VLVFSFINVLSNLLVRGISVYNFFKNNKCYIRNIKLIEIVANLNQIRMVTDACCLHPSSSRVERGAQPPHHESREAQLTPVPPTECGINWYGYLFLESAHLGLCRRLNTVFVFFLIIPIFNQRYSFGGRQRVY
jgi:hypothetical protein